MKQPNLKINKQLILRQLRKSDAKSLVKYGNNKKIAVFLTDSFPHPYKVSDARKFIRNVLNEVRKKEPKNIVFGIEINGEVVGCVGLHKVKHDHKAEFGYWLGENFWGGGIMTKAVKKVSAFAFRELRIRRIVAYTLLNNEGSKRVLEKSGFELEGIAKKYLKKKNKFLDVYQFAKTK